MHQRKRTIFKELSHTLICGKKLIVCYNKTMIKGDILIDDCLDNFGGQPLGIVLDYPWNRYYKDGIIRCSWENIEINKKELLLNPILKKRREIK